MSLIVLATWYSNKGVWLLGWTCLSKVEYKERNVITNKSINTHIISVSVYKTYASQDTIKNSSSLIILTHKTASKIILIMCL
jgi:hypothetical protein